MLCMFRFKVIADYGRVRTCKLLAGPAQSPACVSISHSLVLRSVTDATFAVSISVRFWVQLVHHRWLSASRTAESLIIACTSAPS